MKIHGALLLVATLGSAIHACAQSSGALDSARAAAARGATPQAIALYRAAIRADSTARPALRELSGLLSSNGRWPEALPLARRLSALGVSDFTLERDLGQWMSWSGQSDSGVIHLRKAVVFAPDSLELILSFGQALTWNPPTRSEGIAVLRSLERRTPDDPALRHALASALSWNVSTRGEGLRRYATLVRDRPTDLSATVDYADALSWVADTRPLAMQLYARVAERDVRNSRAVLGRLNVLTWTGRSSAALALADSLLVASPDDTALVRSRGTLLMQVGRPQEAVTVLRELIARTPSDPKLNEQLAYALLAAGHLREAHALASTLPKGAGPGAADWVRRGSAAAVSVDALSTHTSLGLSLNRVVATISYPLSAVMRVSISGRPTWFHASSGSFASNALGVAIDGKLPGLRSARAEVGVERYPNAADAWSASVEGEAQLGRSATLRVIARRAAVEDSRRAASGQTESGRSVGPVRASSATLILRLPELPGGLVFASTLSLGTYTASALRTNIKREANAALIRPIPLGGLRVEVGAGVSYLGFTFDANRSSAFASANEIGGYWSPKGFGNAFASLGLSVPVTGRFSLRADGAFGRQVAGLQAGASVANVAAGGEARIVGHQGWDGSLGYLYLDNLGGFRLRQFRAGLRHAF